MMLRGPPELPEAIMKRKRGEAEGDRERQGIKKSY